MGKQLTYNTGMVATLLISVGVAAIAYGGGVIPFVPLNILAWLLGPIGVYTILYAFRSGDVFFYLGWGSIMLTIAAASMLYTVVNTFVVLGILLIALALLGLFAYKKQTRT
jgi:hypothetical protein